jgi:hypothetical protein
MRIGRERSTVFALQEGRTGTVFEGRKQSAHHRGVLLGDAVLVRFQDPRFAAGLRLLALRVGQRPELLVHGLELHLDLRKVE